MKLYLQNAFPPESNQFPSKIMLQIYGGTGLEFNAIDKRCATLGCIIQLYAEIRTMTDEYEIAMIRARIADLKEERMDYVEHCMLHNRLRRS